jgi:hypothetical protein
LVGWWAGEGNANDSSSQGNVGNVLSGITFVPGVDGQAFQFDGSTGAIIVPPSASLAVQSFTIEAWINPSDVSIPRPILEYNDPGQYTYVSFWYGINPGGVGVPGALYGIVRDANPQNYMDFGTVGNLLPPNQWSHVAWTFDTVALTTSLYLNGVNVATRTFPAPLHPTTTLSANIGLRPEGTLDLWGGRRHIGGLDEVSVYNRALSASEIQAIYGAGSAGKCTTTTPSPPVIYAQPTNQTAFAGQTVTMTVGAYGTAPLGYVWSFNGSPIDSATNSSIVLTNVQQSQSGSYVVQVTNSVGSTNSLAATLTVNPTPPCAGPASGLVSWWQAEGNGLDAFGGNNAIVSNSITYIPGVVGQAFNFDGVTGAVVIPPSPNLAVQSLTIEGWIKPTDVSNARPIVEYGAAGELTDVSFWYSYVPGALYAIVRDANPANYMQLSSAGGLIAPNQWSHVAFTLDLVSNVAKLFLNGAPVAINNFQVSLHPHTLTTVNLGLRAVGSADLLAGRRHMGGMDEISIYARALSPEEISAIYNAGSLGKCSTPVAPSIYAQPTDQTVTIGSVATFSAGVSGTQPLSYQWTYQGSPISGATTPLLVLANVQQSQAGTYAVIVTNALGSVTSSNASLTVNFPPASVVAENSSADALGNVTVPIILNANGNENAVGFSLNFNPALLSYAGTSLGNGAPGATLLVNSNQVANGQLGIALSLPTGMSFSGGTQEVVDVTFAAAVLTNGTLAQVTFGDNPTSRKLSDPQANSLAANFIGGTVSIPAADFEGDVSPRPNGDKAVTITDWVLVGRYAARLDYPTNASEYQRADCAPRSTLGDGAITVADWVQTGRYAVGLDPATRAGGPTNDVGPLVVNLTSKPKPKGLTRQVRVANVNLVQGQSGTVSVYLDAQGDENALSFSVAFDPTVLGYVVASVGADAPGATLDINTNQAGTGKAAFLLALPIGSSFTAGTKEILKLNLGTVPSAAGMYPVALTDQPVVRQVVDAAAALLTATYQNGSVTVNPPPSLTAMRSQQNINLSWPLWATNFVLQEADGTLMPSLTWSNVPAAFSVTNNAAVVTLPISGTTKFYRLQK